MRGGGALRRTPQSSFIMIVAKRYLPSALQNLFFQSSSIVPEGSTRLVVPAGIFPTSPFDHSAAKVRSDWRLTSE